MKSKRIITIKKDILKESDKLANKLRKKFAKHNVFVVNIVSSPGSGKTELLGQTLKKLKNTYALAAVTADLATENDAERLKKSGAKIKQILTGTMCHLEVNMVETAIKDWDLSKIDFLFIENVGNLVCPGGFDLGEDLRVMLIATTEGEDKPVKYPTLTVTADVVVINKIDLASVVDCNISLLEKNIHEIRPDAQIFKLSAKIGNGINNWIKYLENQFINKANNA